MAGGLGQLPAQAQRLEDRGWPLRLPALGQGPSQVGADSIQMTVSGRVQGREALTPKE